MATQSVTVSRTAAGGASKTSGTPAPSRAEGTDYSLSDLELLGVVEEAAGEVSGSPEGREEGRPEKGTVATSPQTKPPAENAPRGPQEKSGDQRAAPALAEFAEAFELPGVGPKLREICERESAYRQAFPSVEQARAVREVFTNPEAARAAAAAQSELARIDALVESRDPRAHAELLGGLQRLAPESIRSLAVAFAELLPRLDAEAHRRVMQSLGLRKAPEQAAGHGERLPEDSTRTHGQNDTDRGYQNPNEAALGLEKSAQIHAPQIRAAQAAGEFLEAVNADVQQAMRAAVEQKVEEMMPDAPSGAREKIAGEIFRDLDLTLRGDQELQDQVREAVRNAMQQAPGESGLRGAWREGPNERARDVVHRGATGLARLIARRAKAALPSVAKRVVADWTETVLRSSQARRARQSEAASRAEIGRGGAPAPVPAVPRRVDYSRMSDEEILNMD